MSTIDHAATRADLARQVADFLADPRGWPAAMAARALRLRDGHAPYSPNNQGLILAQLLMRFLADEGDAEAAFRKAVEVAAQEIAPRSVWARRGFAPQGNALTVYSRPVLLWLDPTTGKKVPASTPGAKKKSIFKLEQTFCATDVRDEQGNTAVGAYVPPPFPGGQAREVFERLQAWITGQGWTVVRTGRHTEEAGSTVHHSHTIQVSGALAAWDAVETLAHEIAHALLHGADETRPYAGEHRGDMEAEAESVAYGLMVAFDQHEAARSAARYMAEWTRSPERVALAYEQVSYVLDAVVAVALGDDTAQVKKSAKEARAEVKARNQELAAALRSAGLEPKGEAWVRAKAGEDVAAIAADLIA